MQDILLAVKQHWQEQGVAHGPPVNERDIAAFEARYGILLPAELRTYFATLNGSELGHSGPMDGSLLSFWNLSQVRPLTEEFTQHEYADGASYFLFADYSIGVHAYAVRLSPESSGRTPVVVIYDEFLVEVAPSFPAFLDGYLRDDQDILFPDPPAAWRAAHPPPAV